ncbi:serine endopeptidase [Colletotrichum cuscutae]|uniref:Serine endopeptidase n=1 Tax=Colletotrichum cuscutae TaxID=1209917 RepID=A0AAI9UZ78_9PEZI|nr:serine endopeptidase [Colletotrichum cuscutae]
MMLRIPSLLKAKRTMKRLPGSLNASPWVKCMCALTCLDNDCTRSMLRKSSVTASHERSDVASIVVSERNTVTPGFLSVDSSWGPTYELDIKPQFVAPGGMVLSTFPRSKGYYAVLTGTSMACPLAAGIYALLMEARGTKDPEELETIISSTSKPVKFHDGRNESPFLAPVPQQGSGMIQAYDAARV